MGMESTNIVNGRTFHWCSKCTPPQWSTTHSMVTHTDYPTTSIQNTNAQLLDFDAATWVINLSIHNLNLTIMKAPHQQRLQHLGQPSEPSAMLTEPPVSPLTMPSFTLPNQPLSLAPPMPPLMGATCLQSPPWSSGTP